MKVLSIRSVTVLVNLLLTAALLGAGCGDDTGDGGGGTGAAGAAGGAASGGDGGTAGAPTGGAGGTPTGEGCPGLCVAGGFDDGTEMDFGGGVVECLCDGDGTGISEDDCDDYCAEFDVEPAAALVTTEVTANDKCVCDGTGS